MGNCKLSTSAALPTPKKPLVDSSNPVNDDSNIDAENLKSVAINSSMNENGNNDSTYTCNTSQEAVKETINCLLNKVIDDSYLKYGGSYAGDHKDTPDFKYITYTIRPEFTPSHRSLMVKYLSVEMFEKLKNVKSMRGYTFSNAIQTGVVTPHLGVGITAGDEECWEIYKEIFYPIIKEWHNYNPETQKHYSDLDSSKVLLTEEQLKLFNKYVISTRVRAARNISGYTLPAGTTEIDRRDVETILHSCFDIFPEEIKGSYYPLGDLSEEDRKELQENGFLFQVPSARNLLTGAGAARDWPANRGIFFDGNKSVIVWVNEEDHCRIIAMDNSGDIKLVFEKFCKLSNELKIALNSQGHELMYNETLGFLGTCPSNLGTGMRASVMIHLPELNKNSGETNLLERICEHFDLQLRGSAGEHSTSLDSKFDISNKERLGFTEVELINKLITGVSKIIEYEVMLQEELITVEEIEANLKVE